MSRTPDLVEPPLTLTLSPRDVQWVAALLAVGAALLRDSEADVDHNLDMLDRVYAEEYSSTEFNALTRRARALLPPNTPLRFAEGFHVGSQTTLVQ